MKCDKCFNDFPEAEIQDSHDIPKYMGGTDRDGRHWLCERCHKDYEEEVLRVSTMNFIKNNFPKEWKETCKRSARMVKRYFFKNKGAEDENDG